jgi:hypothetical protein
MQKIFFLMLALLAMSPKFHAEEPETAAAVSAEPQPPQQEAESAETLAEEGAHPQLGAASESSAEASRRAVWQNWVFAGSALATVTAGVVIISLNSGNSSH